MLLIALASQAQSQMKITKDPDNNIGLFGIIQASYIKNYKASFRQIEPGSDKTTNLDTKNSNTYSLNMIVGYFILPKRLSLGMGFGLDGYHNPNANTAPLYGDLRFYLTSGRNIPYLYIDYGYLVKLGVDFHKGQVGRIGVGYKFFVSKKLCMTADVSFTAKSVSYTNDAVRPHNALNIKGIGFTLGFFLF